MACHKAIRNQHFLLSAACAFGVKYPAIAQAPTNNKCDFSMIASIIARLTGRPGMPQKAPSGWKRDFHKRAGESHAEARKFLTAMAVGTLAVLYATLTGKDAPSLA